MASPKTIAAPGPVTEMLGYIPAILKADRDPFDKPLVDVCCPICQDMLDISYNAWPTVIRSVYRSCTDHRIQDDFLADYHIEPAVALICGHVLGQKCYEKMVAEHKSRTKDCSPPPPISCPICRFKLQFSVCGCLISPKKILALQDKDFLRGSTPPHGPLSFGLTLGEDAAGGQRGEGKRNVDVDVDNVTQPLPPQPSSEKREASVLEVLRSGLNVQACIELVPGLTRNVPLTLPELSSLSTSPPEVPQHCGHCRAAEARHLTEHVLRRRCYRCRIMLELAAELDTNCGRAVADGFLASMGMRLPRSLPATDTTEPPAVENGAQGWLGNWGMVAAMAALADGASAADAGAAAGPAMWTEYIDHADQGRWTLASRGGYENCVYEAVDLALPECWARDPAARKRINDEAFCRALDYESAMMNLEARDRVWSLCLQRSSTGEFECTEHAADPSISPLIFEYSWGEELSHIPWNWLS